MGNTCCISAKKKNGHTRCMEEKPNSFQDLASRFTCSGESDSLDSSPFKESSIVQENSLLKDQFPFNSKTKTSVINSVIDEEPIGFMSDEDEDNSKLAMTNEPHNKNEMITAGVSQTMAPLPIPFSKKKNSHCEKSSTTIVADSENKQSLIQNNAVQWGENSDFINQPHGLLTNESPQHLFGSLCRSKTDHYEEKTVIKQHSLSTDNAACCLGLAQTVPVITTSSKSEEIMSGKGATTTTNAVSCNSTRKTINNHSYGTMKLDHKSKPLQNKLTCGGLNHSSTGSHELWPRHQQLKKKNKYHSTGMNRTNHTSMEYCRRYQLPLFLRDPLTTSASTVVMSNSCSVGKKKRKLSTKHRVALLNQPSYKKNLPSVSAIREKDPLPSASLEKPFVITPPAKRRSVLPNLELKSLPKLEERLLCILRTERVKAKKTCDSPLMIKESRSRFINNEQRPATCRLAVSTPTIKESL